MKNKLNHLNAPTRRQFVERLAASAFALNLIPVQSTVAQNNLGDKGFGKAKRLIVILLDAPVFPFRWVFLAFKGQRVLSYTF